MTSTMKTSTTRSTLLALAALWLGGDLLAGSVANGQNLSERINYVMQQRRGAQERNASKARMLGVLLYTDLTLQPTDPSQSNTVKRLWRRLRVSMRRFKRRTLARSFPGSATT